MAIQVDTARYVGMPYVFKNGPARVPSLRAARKKGGVNCQTTTHLVLRDLGLAIPSTMLSAEIFRDPGEFFVDVNGALHLGDVYVFTRPGERDPRNHHLAPVVGRVDGKPYLLDASQRHRHVRVATLPEIEKYGRQVVAIKRRRR